MRKSLWFVALWLLFSAVGAPNAHADTYAISFSGTNAPSVVGSDLLSYNSPTMEFTTPSLELNFEGTDYVLDLDVPSARNPPTLDSYEWMVGINTLGNPGVVKVVDTSSGTAVYYDLLNSVPFSYALSGGASLVLTSTPEPSLISLMLIGLASLGLMTVMQRRKAQGLA